MTTRTRAQSIVDATMKLTLRPQKGDREKVIAAALREAVEGLNIEPDPDRELSIEKHHFIKGQNWVKDAIMRLADELDGMAEE